MENQQKPALLIFHMSSRQENWVHIFTSGNISFQLNVVSDISFLGSMKYSEPLELRISKQPFDVSSFWTKFNKHNNKDEGNRSCFFPLLCFLLSKAPCCLPLYTAPLPYNTQKQISSLTDGKVFLNTTVTPRSRRYASMWRHLVKPLICLLVSQSFQPPLPSRLLCFWWFASHVTRSNYN